MSCSDFWEKEGVSFKRLPTVQDLLRCCDDDLFVRVVMEGHALPAAGGKGLDPKRLRAARQRIGATLEVMRGLPVRRKGGRVLLPEEAFVLHAQTNLIERRVAATLVSLKDADAARRALAAAGEGRTAPGLPASDAKPAWPARRSYTLAPWEKTLGARVWLGGPWCRRERYLVLASAFWEMTYYGFEYDRAVARQAEEKARLLAGEPRQPVSAAARDVAEEYGLREPDRFAEDYRDRLALCVATLNEAAQRDFWQRLVALARHTPAA